MIVVEIQGLCLQKTIRRGITDAVVAFADLGFDIAVNVVEGLDVGVKLARRRASRPSRINKESGEGRLNTSALTRHHGKEWHTLGISHFMLLSNKFFRVGQTAFANSAPVLSLFVDM